MLDLSKERSVSFLREVGKQLQEKILFLERENIQLKKERATDEEISKKLSDELLVLRKKFFVKGGERVKSKDPSKKRNKKKLIHNRPPLDGEKKAKEKEEEKDPSVDLDIEKVLHPLEDIKCSTCDDKSIRIIKMRIV